MILLLCKQRTFSSCLHEKVVKVFRENCHRLVCKYVIIIVIMFVLAQKEWWYRNGEVQTI